VPDAEYCPPTLIACEAAASTLSCIESVIFDVISAALTGVMKNNEKAKRSFFIVLKIMTYLI
jgi:hypothetical protein